MYIATVYFKSVFFCPWIFLTTWPPDYATGPYKPSIHRQTNLHRSFTLTIGLIFSRLSDADLACYFPQVLALSLTTIIGKWEKEQRQTLCFALTYILLFNRGEKALWKDYLSRHLHASSKECHFVILTKLSALTLPSYLGAITQEDWSEPPLMEGERKKTLRGWKRL